MTEKEFEDFPPHLVQSYQQARAKGVYSGTLNEWLRVRHMIYRTQWAKEHHTEAMSYRAWLEHERAYAKQCGF